MKISGVMRTGFFIINFAGFTALAVTFLASVFSPSLVGPGPHVPLGGIIFFPPFAALAIGEAVAYRRRNRKLECFLGALCLAFGQMVLLGALLCVFEAIRKGTASDDSVWVGAGMVAVVAYLTFCGCMRIWGMRDPG